MKHLIHVMKKQWKKTTNVFIAILIILLVISIGISVYIPKSEGSIQAVITVASTFNRIDEPIQFSSDESRGEIQDFRWDFGDGNYSDEENPIHSYLHSNWYNVTLTAVGSNEITSTASIIIEIQRHDEGQTNGRGPARSWRPDQGLITALFSQSHPNTGNPILSVDLQVSNPIGSVSVIIDIDWDDPVNGRMSYDFYRSETIESGDDIELHLTIQPEDFPDDIGMNNAVVGCIYTLRDGRDSGVSLVIGVEYPWSNSF